MNVRQCDQTRCAHHPANNRKIPIDIGGDTIKVDSKDLCPECAECGCPPHEIDEDCPNCWNCLKDEGYTRDGMPGAIKQALKEKYGEHEEECPEQTPELSLLAGGHDNYGGIDND